MIIYNNQLLVKQNQWPYPNLSYYLQFLDPIL